MRRKFWWMFLRGIWQGENEYKIHKDEIEWLVSVYNASIDEEVTKESYEKLIEYGLTQANSRYF